MTIGETFKIINMLGSILGLMAISMFAGYQLFHTYWGMFIGFAAVGALMNNLIEWEVKRVKGLLK